MRPYALSLGYGFLNGIGMCWLISVLYRAHIDSSSFWSLAEFWLSLSLFLAVFSLSVVSFLPEIKAHNLRWRPYIPLVGGLFSGGFLVMAWGTQSMVAHEDGFEASRVGQVQAFASPLLTAHPFVQLSGSPPAPKNPETVTPETVASWCGLSRQLWFDVFSQPLDMDLGVYEKSILKDVYAQSYALGCLSEQDFFDVVRNLRYRSTLVPEKRSSVFDWSFTPSWERHDTAQQLLAITRGQWCAHKEWARSWREDKKWVSGSAVEKCSLLNSPETPLNSPE